MTNVEIIYRYSSPGAPTRPRPHNSEAARLRLSDGNHAFATLLDGLSQGTGVARRVIDVDPRDLGLLRGEHSAPMQHPFESRYPGCSATSLPYVAASSRAAASTTIRSRSRMPRSE
jgi:hypothetical protein